MLRLVLGTRGSRLALAQAEIVADRFRTMVPAAIVTVRTVTTSGDRDRSSRLSDIGGKGVFIRELEQALIGRDIDIAVHSFKDITAHPAPGLCLSGFFRPESVRDVLITAGPLTLDELPRGARVGTGSARRRTLLSRLRGDLRMADIRGNIDTRLVKLDRGEYDAIMLSEAGVIRLGLTRRELIGFDPATFYPAPGQGVITLEVRDDDPGLRDLCKEAGDRTQWAISNAELGLLRTVGFDCRTPLGVHSVLDGNDIVMRGFFMKPDGGRFVEREARGPFSDPEPVGAGLGRTFLDA
jgi:hydroxymethylbilane synthase